MTVVPPGKVKQADFANMPWGKEVELTVINRAYDDQGIAVVVRPSISLPFVETQVPHITVAHSMMVNPVYSNSLLANHEKWDRPTFRTYVDVILCGSDAEPHRRLPTNGFFTARQSYHQPRLNCTWRNQDVK